jgi:hypothetical protein
MVTSSTVQQARQELADTLREIRLDVGLTARAVAPPLAGTSADLICRG